MYIQFIAVLIILSSVGWFLVSYRISNRLFNVLSVYIAFFVLHNCVHSIHEAFGGAYRHHPWITATADDWYNVALFNLLGLNAFCVGYLLVSRRIQFAELLNSTGSKGILVPPAWLETIAFSMTSYTLFQALIADNSIYGANQANSASEAFSPLGTLMLLRIGIMLVALALRKAAGQTKLPNYYLVWILMEIACDFLKGGRKGIVLAFIGVACVWLFTRPIHVRNCVRICSIIVVVLACCVFISTARNYFGQTESRLGLVQVAMNDSEKLQKTFEKIIFSSSSEGVQAWTSNIYLTQNESMMYGRTYAQALTNVVVPRPAQGPVVHWQAAYAFKQRAYPGVTNMGFDYSFSAEAIQNFGHMAWMVHAFAGVFLGLLARNSKRSFFCGFLVLFYVASTSIYLRTDSTGFFRMWLTPVFIVYVMHLLVQYVRAANTSTQESALPRGGHIFLNSTLNVMERERDLFLMQENNNSDIHYSNR